MSDHSSLVAQFLAKGGKVKTISMNTRAYDEREIFDATRQGGKARAVDDTMNNDAELEACRKRDAFDEARYMGASMEVAMRDYDNA